MGIGNRNSQHSFAEIPDVHIGRSSFDRSFGVKDTFDFDYLVPVLVDEVIPGDTFKLKVSSFARIATQIVPVMDNMYLDWFFFFVPNRLVYDKWEQLNGAQNNPGDSVDYICPQLTIPADGPEVDSIYDKYGMPTDIPAGYVIKNTLSLRGYNRIWRDWFKDENLQNDVVQNIDQGPDAYSEYALLKRGKRKDYFTSALPWPQKGTAVSMPLGTTAPVVGIGKTNGNFTTGPVSMRESTGTTASYGFISNLQTAGVDNQFAVKGTAGTNGYPAIFADLSAATSATINQLRQAFMMQSLMELDARGGTRYVEILKAHFGVISPDFRLQRTEYLGGGTTSVNVHPVPQTSPTSGANAQGQLAAYATASTTGEVGFSKSFVEHGYVIGLVCARADVTYQQGLNKTYSRSTRYDFFWPKLQELGEQTVLNKEIYLQGTVADDQAFGYQERYAEYRYMPSQIKGRFRSTYAQSLDQWHLAQEFGSLPGLNSSFVVQDTPIERAIAIDTEPDIMMDMFFNYHCARPMLTYSVPATLGRF